MLTKLKELLTVNSFKGIQKKRIGSIADGGYLIIINYLNNETYDCYIGCGIGNNSDFENDVYVRYDNIPIYCFDGTIDRFPYNKIHNLQFFRKNISSIESSSTSNMIDLLGSYNNIFMKMDIEGSEWEYFYNLHENYFNNINLLVLELHWDLNNIDLCINTLEKIRKYFYIFHIHGCSCGPLVYVENFLFPCIMELTLINKSKVSHKEIILNKSSLPCELDFSNSIDNNQYDLNYEPFVFK